METYYHFVLPVAFGDHRLLFQGAFVDDYSVSYESFWTGEDAFRFSRRNQPGPQHSLDTLHATLQAMLPRPPTPRADLL